METKTNMVFGWRYRLLKKLGQGSFGEVWQARDEELDIEVAIKIYIAMDDRGIETFRSEYKVAYELNHTNLIHANYFDVSDQRPYLVMPYCARGSAENLIDDIAYGGHVPEETLWRFLHDVSSGLAYLHQQEPPLVHQDIKPANILIDNQGYFVITDFGISTRIRSSLRRSSRNANSSAGTIAYMAPERFSSERTLIKASDVWSLGATLYEIATGDLPFLDQGGSLQKAGAEMPELGGEYSAELNGVMQACLSQEPWLRPTAEELQEYTTDRLKGRPGAKPWEERGEPDRPNPTPPTPKPKPQPKGWLRYVLLAIAIVLGVVLCVTLPKGCGGDEPTAEVVDTVSEGENTVTVEEVVEVDRTAKEESRSKEEEPQPVDTQEEPKAKPTAQEQAKPAVAQKPQEPAEPQSKPQKPEVVLNGYISGHEYVDLGLSVKWATCNVGASSPADSGDYFAWGETTPKATYTESNSVTYGNSSIGNIAGDARYDAARANWGGSWRLPTNAEIQELLDNCTSTWTTQNGVKGRLFTSKKNGNSIFLPAAGYRYGSSLSYAGEYGHYWSATPYESDSSYAYRLYFYSGNADWYWIDRGSGRSVRPVSE